MTVVRESAVGDFAPWIRRHAGNRDGAVLIFPHAGGTSAGYRGLADAISGDGPDAFVMQYPQRGERVAHAAAVTIQALVDDLFAAGPWADVAPLALFGHSMGALIAFEFARAAADHGIAVQQLWVSAGPAPSSVAELPGLPDNDAALIAEMAALGGTDPELLADPEFAELILPPCAPTTPRWPHTGPDLTFGSTRPCTYWEHATTRASTRVSWPDGPYTPPAVSTRPGIRVDTSTYSIRLNRLPHR